MNTVGKGRPQSSRPTRSDEVFTLKRTHKQTIRYGQAHDCSPAAHKHTVTQTII